MIFHCLAPAFIGRFVIGSEDLPSLADCFGNLSEAQVLSLEMLSYFCDFCQSCFNPFKNQISSATYGWRIERMLKEAYLVHSRRATTISKCCAILRYMFEALTFGCRLYFRLLPVVARDVTLLLLLLPDSAPDAVRFGESSSFTAVLVCCGGVGSGLATDCDLSFLYSAMARCSIYRSCQQS